MHRSLKFLGATVLSVCNTIIAVIAIGFIAWASGLYDQTGRNLRGTNVNENHVIVVSAFIVFASTSSFLYYNFKLIKSWKYAVSLGILMFVLLCALLVYFDLTNPEADVNQKGYSMAQVVQQNQIYDTPQTKCGFSYTEISRGIRIRDINKASISLGNIGTGIEIPINSNLHLINNDCAAIQATDILIGRTANLYDNSSIPKTYVLEQLGNIK